MVFKRDACAVLAAFCADCSLKYFQFAPSVLAMHSPHEHVNTLAQATVSVPLFVPLSKWFSGHKGTAGVTEGHKKHVVFIDVFYFVQENRKVQKLRRRTL